MAADRHVVVVDEDLDVQLLADGKAVNYEGASGPCKFTPTGDIAGCKFRFEVAEKGKYKLLSIS